MYAYFIKLEEYPEVYPTDADDEQINRNYDMLLFITKEAERRGIDFILGIWQVRSWSGEEGNWKLPASYINKAWDILYYFDIVDVCGEGIIYPDFLVETPYCVVNVE